MHRFGSNSIAYLHSDLAISADNEVAIPTGSRMRVEILKKLTRYFVIERSEMKLAQVGQRKIVRDLFFELRHLVMDNPPHEGSLNLPGRLVDYCVAAKVEASYLEPIQFYSRAVVDFICSLPDRQAATMADQISGRVTRTPEGFGAL